MAAMMRAVIAFVLPPAGPSSAWRVLRPHAVSAPLGQAALRCLATGAKGGRPKGSSNRKTKMQLGASNGGPELLRDFGGANSGGGNGGVAAEGSGDEPADPRIVPVELKTELSTAFMQYAMSTILGRALPDARDGLKPVHRRILYAMHVLNLQPDGGYRKCARVVGEVLGKYHPHGDMSVYDALVRMAQDFVMSAPLIAGHGNFGSVDNDPAAAMRYTECKLSGLARDTLLADISLDTVSFVPNFDGNEVEPLVLPARVPMLLLNGATGIAVGMATNVPPHNLGELIDGVLALIDDPTLPHERLLRLVPAPDFPTGGLIMGLDGAAKMYTTGLGGVVIRAKTHMETISIGGGRQSRNAIVVTEMPYQVNKAALLEKIAEIVNDKKLDGIADLRDESDRDGIRVVIELKRDAVPTVVENNLFKKTQLQVSFPGNLLALSSDGKQPQRLTLRDALQTFVDFRFQVIRRRTQHELSKVEAREHIVEGLIRALDRIDGIVEVVRKAPDTAAARATLMGKDYAMTEPQANAILALTLGRLTALEDKKLRQERDELLAKMEELRALMQQDDKVFDVMRGELRDIKRKHAVPRRSVIKDEAAELTEMDLLANERSVVMVTGSGYIKRMPLVEFEQQRRGTRGKAGARMAEDDLLMHFLACNDHDRVLFISEKGVAFAVRAFQVPLGSRTAKGVPLPQVLPLSSDDTVSSVIPMTEPIKTDEYLVLLTTKGYIKKTRMEAFAKPLSNRGLIAITLEEGDALRWARRCVDGEDIIISTRLGYSMRFASADLRASGRQTRGVRAIKLRPGDEMVDIAVLGTQKGEGRKYLLAVTTNGYGKRIPASAFKQRGRGGMGVIAIKFKAGLGDSLACMRGCADNDEVVLSTQRGTIVRQLVKDIPVQSRTATGVRVQRLDEGNSLLSVAVLPPEASGDQQGKAGKAKGEQRHAVEVGLVDGEGEEEPEEEGEEAAVGGV